MVTTNEKRLLNLLLTQNKIKMTGQNELIKNVITILDVDIPAIAATLKQEISNIKDLLQILEFTHKDAYYPFWRTNLENNHILSNKIEEIIKENQTLKIHNLVLEHFEKSKRLAATSRSNDENITGYSNRIPSPKACVGNPVHFVPLNHEVIVSIQLGILFNTLLHNKDILLRDKTTANTSYIELYLTAGQKHTLANTFANLEEYLKILGFVLVEQNDTHYSYFIPFNITIKAFVQHYLPFLTKRSHYPEYNSRLIYLIILYEQPLNKSLEEIKKDPKVKNFIEEQWVTTALQYRNAYIYNDKST